MKTSKTIVSSVLILALLLGAAVILQLSAPKPVTANVEFDPDTIDLGAPGWAVKEVVVTVWFKGKYDGSDVNPKTVMVDEVLSPKGGWKHTWVEKTKVDDDTGRATRWVFRFKLAGGAVKAWLWQKIVHMTPGITLTVPLVVTGNLYDGTAFTGTGYIDVLVPTTPLVNPPPSP